MAGSELPLVWHDDVACTACGCVCDDLRLGVQGNRIVRAEPACTIAEPWLLTQETAHPPVAQRAGGRVAYEAALTEAAELLRRARYPVIYGLSRSSTEGQRAAVALADYVGATVDTTASLCHAPSVMALQEVGESTCTLGEVKNRADLVIYWGADPLSSHPRHIERYAGPERKRTIVVVDSQPNKTSAVADWFVPIEPGRDFEALWALRALLRGLAPAENGIELDAAKKLIERMRACRCGVVFFGLGLSATDLGHRSVAALLSLVTELNDFTRFYARRLRIQGDVTGADSVLAWQTGYPFSVNLSRGYPRYNPDEFSVEAMLERREPDLALFVGSETVGRFSAAAHEHLRTIPVIALDHPHVTSEPEPLLRFTTAVYGIHRPGTAYRMDEIPLPLRAVLSSEYPADHDVLEELLARIERRAATVREREAPDAP